MSQKRLFVGYETNVFWNAGSWLPDSYRDPQFVIWSLSSSLGKRNPYGHCIMAYGDEEKFPEDLLEGYFYASPRVHGFHTTRGSEHGRVNLMLAKIVLMASFDPDRRVETVVVTKLSQDSEMICRVVASLRRRRFRVVFALPEVDVDKAKTSFGITVYSEQNGLNERIPVWLCPHLFDTRPEGHEDGDEQHRYFIEPPTPDAHTTSFAMPADVDTCVFWDVEDYPLPPGLQLRSFYQNIISAVPSHVTSSTGTVSIYAYVVKEFEFEAEAEDARISITVVRKAPADKFARLAQMTMDFLFWSMDNPPADRDGPCTRPNLLLISQLLEDGRLDVRVYLSNLIRRGYNAFLALPDAKIPSSSSHLPPPLLSWEDLSAKGKRKSRDSLD